MCTVLPRSEILPVKMDREKDVPGLFHRLLFLDSAKKKITCGVGIDANPGSTQGHFNRENLRARYRASGTFFLEKTPSELSLMYCKFGSLLQPFPVAADFFDLHLELEHNFFNLQYKFLYLQCKILYLQYI